MDAHQVRQAHHVGYVLVVLLREDFGRGHQRSLVTVSYRDKHRRERNGGFAGAHVALNQAVHADGFRHIRGDLFDYALLRAGKLERQDFLELLVEISRNLESYASARSLDPALSHRKRKLQQEKLLEDEPLPRCFHRLDTLGEVDVAHSDLCVHQVQSIPHFLRQVFLDQRAVGLQGICHDPAQGVLEKPFGQRIDWHHAAAGKRIGVLGVQLPLGRAHLHAPSAGRDRTVGNDLPAPQLQELLLAPLLIEPRQHQRACAVIHHDLGQHQLAPGLHVVGGKDCPPDGGRLPVLEAGDPRELGAVLVASREVIQQIAHGVYVQLFEDLGQAWTDAFHVLDFSAQRAWYRSCAG